jgi:hypothetical protein
MNDRVLIRCRRFVDLGPVSRGKSGVERSATELRSLLSLGLPQVRLDELTHSFAVRS